MLVFAMCGALFGTIVPRYPQIQDDVGLSNARFGAALAVYAAGAMLAGPATDRVIRQAFADTANTRKPGAHPWRSSRSP